MIRLTRLNGTEFYLNPDLVETVESCPDTVITMSDGKKYVVREGPEEIVDAIVAYRRRIMAVRSGSVRKAQGR